MPQVVNDGVEGALAERFEDLGALCDAQNAVGLGGATAVELDLDLKKEKYQICDEKEEDEE